MAIKPRVVYGARNAKVIWRFATALGIAAGLHGASIRTAPAAEARLLKLEVDGSRLQATLSDGRALRSEALVGAVLTMSFAGAERRIRIDAVDADPGDPSNGMPASQEIVLHTLSMQSGDGMWHNVCDAGPDGRRQALLIAGRAGDGGMIWPAETGAFEITCTGGAQGKCLRFGYWPWKAAGNGLGPYDLYNACVRMVRADYAGDGVGTTLDGQPIVLYDFQGIQGDESAAGMEFEAGWTKAGAVCVRHVRVKENVTLTALDMLKTLKGRTGEICTEHYARAHGAVIFNQSPP